MADTRKTKAQLIAELETLRARVKSLGSLQTAFGQNGEHLRSIAENAPVGIGLYRNGITLYVNQTYARMAGYSDSMELVGRHFIDLVAPQCREELIDRNRRRELGENVPSSYETVCLRKDGAEYPVHVQATHIDLPDGPVTIGFFTDITGRKEAQEIAHQAEMKYRHIYENATEGIFQSTPQGIFLTVNPAMARIYGYDSPEDMLSTVSDIPHQMYADPQARTEFARSLQENGKIEGFETRGLRKDGSTIWISCNAHVVLDESGAIAYYEGTLEDITTRKQAEEQSALLKLSVDASADGAYWMDTEGRFLYVNEAGCKALGYTREELLQMRVFDVNPRVTPQRWAELWKQLREEGSFSAESIHQRKDGSCFPVEINSTYIRFEEREYCNGFAHDITNRQQAHEALMVSEERYRTLAEAAHDMIFTIGKDRTIGYVNRFAADQLRIQPEAIIGKNMADMFPGESGQRQRENIDRTLTSNTSHYIEAPITFPGGERWVSTWLVPLKDKTGQVTSVMGVARDITERKQVESELFESRQMLQTVLDNIPQRVFWKDRNLAFVGCNRAFALDCGFNNPDEIIGKTSHETASAAIADLYHADDRQVMTTGRPNLNYEEMQIRPNGTLAWLITSKVPLHDKNGQVIGVLGTYEDITERKRDEEALREKTDELDRFFSLALDLLCIANVYGYFIRLNAAWESTLGYKLKDLEGRRFLDLVHPDDQESTLAAVATLSAGQNVIGFVNRYRCQDGSYRWLEWRSVPYQNWLIYAAARDITDRKQTEEALRESEERNRIISELTTDYAFIVDVDSQGALKLRWASDTMARVTGRTISDAPTMDTWRDVIVPEDQDKFFQFIQQIMTTRQPGETEVRSFRRGEAVHWLHILVYPKAGKEESLSIVGAVKDITERKQAEEALRRERALLERIMETSPVTIFVMDREGRITYTNSQAERFIGLSKAEIIGIPYNTPRWNVADENGADVPEEERTFRQVMSTGQTIYDNRRIVDLPDGQHHFSLNCAPLHDESGVVEGVITILSDVTSIVQAQKVQQQYVKRLEALHEIDQAILLAETPQAIAEAALGHLQEMIPGQQASVVIFDFEHDEAEVIASHISTDKIRIVPGARIPMKKIGINADLLHGKISITPDLASQQNRSELKQIMVEEGICSLANVPLVVQGELIGSLNMGSIEIAYFTDERIEIAREVADELAIAIQHARLRERDQRHTEELEHHVTERTAELRAAYEQLQALSRVKDEFVSNVSHELRSPIASAKAYLHLLVTHPDKQEQYVDTLKREIARLEHLIEGLLTLSRLDQNRISANLVTINLNRLIDEYVTDRAPLAESKNLTLTFEPLAQIPGIIGDRQLIGDVLSILLTNAFNYTSVGGKVVISTQMQEAEGDLWAGFSVSDNGWGISPDEAPLLFDRFYRGKAAHKTRVSGTGLGLSIAREIIDLHCGRIEVHSDGIPGHGTKFNVWLPVDMSS